MRISWQDRRSRMMMVTYQSSKQHPSILLLATLGGETATGGTFSCPSRALSTILILQSTLKKSVYNIMPIFQTDLFQLHQQLTSPCVPWTPVKVDLLSSNPFPLKVEPLGNNMILRLAWMSKVECIDPQMVANFSTRSAELDTRYHIDFETQHVCGKSLFTCHEHSF